MIDNLLGTNIGDINKAEIAAQVMNEAFAFAQDKNVAVVIVHHTRKGARTDLVQQQQQGDPLDEAHGSKVFANKAGILIFLRKTTVPAQGRRPFMQIITAVSSTVASMPRMILNYISTRYDTLILARRISRRCTTRLIMADIIRGRMHCICASWNHRTKTGL